MPSALDEIRGLVDRFNALGLSMHEHWTHGRRAEAKALEPDADQAFCAAWSAMENYQGAQIDVVLEEVPPRLTIVGVEWIQ